MVVHLQGSRVGTFAWFSLTLCKWGGFSGGIHVSQRQSLTQISIQGQGYLGFPKELTLFVTAHLTASYVSPNSRPHSRQMRWRMYLVGQGKVPRIKLWSPHKRQGHLAGYSKRQWKGTYPLVVSPSSLSPSSLCSELSRWWNAVEKNHRRETSLEGPWMPW